MSESKQVGFVPLPRDGGALSHAVASIHDLQRRCQPWFARLAASGNDISTQNRPALTNIVRRDLRNRVMSDFFP